MQDEGIVGGRGLACQIYGKPPVLHSNENRHTGSTLHMRTILLSAEENQNTGCDGKKFQDNVTAREMKMHERHNSLKNEQDAEQKGTYFGKFH